MGTDGTQSHEGGKPNIPVPRSTLMIGAIAVVLVMVVSLLVWAADPISFYVHTDKSEYSPGESVLISAEFVNRGSSPANLTFSSGGMAMFLVYDSSDRFVCEIAQITSPVVVVVTVKDGETLVCGISWDQEDSDGLQVAYPASYTIRAVSLSHELDASSSVDILISA